jgi:hypothetical protein
MDLLWSLGGQRRQILGHAAHFTNQIRNITMDVHLV